MVSLGLVERDGDFLLLTLLGKACGRSSLSFDSALRLVELLKERPLGGLMPTDMVPMVLTLAEADASYMPVMKRGQSESARIRDVAGRYGNDAARLLQRFAGENLVYLSRCKKAAVVWDWVHGDSVEKIEARYSPNPYQGRVTYGDIVRAAEQTRYNLRSAHQIISALLVGDQTLLKGLDDLLLQLEMGCPADALQLLKLPVLLTRGEMLALRAAGLRTPADVAAAPADQLSLIVGEDISRKLKTARFKAAV